MKSKSIYLLPNHNFSGCLCDCNGWHTLLQNSSRLWALLWWCKLSRRKSDQEEEKNEQKCSGTSLQLPEFLSAGRSLLSQVIKAFFILVNILSDKKSKIPAILSQFWFWQNFQWWWLRHSSWLNTARGAGKQNLEKKKTLKKCKILVLKGSSYKEKVCTRSTCDGGMFTYEKTTGHFLRTAR